MFSGRKRTGRHHGVTPPCTIISNADFEVALHRSPPGRLLHRAGSGSIRSSCQGAAMLFKEFPTRPSTGTPELTKSCLSSLLRMQPFLFRPDLRFRGRIAGRSSFHVSPSVPRNLCEETIADCGPGPFGSHVLRGSKIEIEALPVFLLVEGLCAGI